MSDAPLFAEHARWIVDPTWLLIESAEKPRQRRLPIFRYEFQVDRQVASATIHICGLGHHELRLNGSRVGTNVLSTPWTNYRKACHYESHDVAEQIRDGANVIGVLLGNGMYRVVGGRYCKFKAVLGPPTLTAILRLRFADDGDAIFGTGNSWRCTDGPITFSCIYGGEDHDARLEISGWDRPDFDATQWRGAVMWDGPGGTLSPAIAPPMRVMKTFEPTAVREFDDGARVYDLGQNFSGWPAIGISGNAGDTVTIRPSELLDELGRALQKPTGSPVSFTYTAKGSSDVERWSPRFSLYGFRYLEVTGAPLRTISGEFVHASVDTVGEFECSNELFNRTHALIVNAIRSNMHHVFTDCPHREKLGWLEQTHLMGQSILCNFDAADLYRKICGDMRDAQHEDGMVPTIAPQYTFFKPPWDIFNDSPEWGSAIVMCPWLVYRNTGDLTIVRENADAMQRYVAYLLGRRNSDGLLDYGLADWYDIGPGDPGFSKNTSAAMTATVTLYVDLKAMSQMAEWLGHRDDSSRYASLAEEVRSACNRKLFNPAKGHYDRNSQCANAMALASGIVTEVNRPRVLANLIADIRAHSNHLTAGDIGFRHVLDALATAGRSDVIFDMLTRTDPPSYGSQLDNGATSLTEAWDANPKSSQNHFMLGHAEGWFHERLAGLCLNVADKGEPPVSIRPNAVGDVIWAKAARRTSQGTIATRWEVSDSHINVWCTVPAGMAALLDLRGLGIAFTNVLSGIDHEHCFSFLRR